MSRDLLRTKRPIKEQKRPTVCPRKVTFEKSVSKITLLSFLRTIWYTCVLIESISYILCMPGGGGGERKRERERERERARARARERES